MIEQTRSKIEDCLKTCLANMPACQNLKELSVPLEIMIRQVAAFIRPECDVEFTPLKKDPQESVSKEESKEEAHPDVTFWMDQLTVAIKKRAKETLAQIQEMLADRAAAEKLIERLQKVNSKSVSIQKQVSDTLTKEIKELQNDENQNFSIKVSVTQEVVDKIKLAIEKISTRKIFGVYSKLETRFNTPYKPINELQDLECPQNDAQSFENYLVAVQNINGIEFNFRFKKGDKSDLKSSEPVNETRIQPEGGQVRRAVVWYNPRNGYLTYIELFDKDGLQLLSVGDTLLSRQDCNNKTHETVLEEGERIIGFKSLKASDTQAWHQDFQFLIGKLI